ncbi:DUF3656 domain-containing protein [Lentisphaerota bacterium WC36G]|nr:U32 family peptidase [Lentisphaerae bacterium WC36]
MTKNINNKNNKYQIPELLAPGGNFECAVVALKSGADAVYVGLKEFNARARSENLSIEELSRLIEFAETSNKKVYVTLNILIKETELNDLFAVLQKLSKLQIHAVIVQDLGIVKIINDFFPEITVHASTQMAIHNSMGIKFSDSLNIKRVILERQVTMEELSLISSKTTTELEVFVHGALCCSLSGTCLFSSWMGGHSGNRGKCKQPCRRRFFNKDGNGFFFSTHDLYSLDLLPKLIENNIASLKIEGRLKKADYVENTVKAYRLILDTIDETQSLKIDNKILGQAKAILQKAVSRRWSHGFYSAESFNNLIKHDSLGVSGSLIGTVEEIKKNGFSVKLSKRLHVGDRIRVQPRSGDDGPAFTVTMMTVNGKPNKLARRNDTAFIHCNKEIPYHSLVYKIGETNNEMTLNINNFPLNRTKFDLEINVTKSEISVQPYFNKTKVGDIWVHSEEFSEAKKHALNNESFLKTFDTPNSDSVKAGNYNLSIEENLFIPASVLKNIKRDFWSYIENKLQDFATFYTDNYIVKREKEFSKLRENLRITNNQQSTPEVNRERKTRTVATASFHDRTRVNHDVICVPIFGKFNGKVEVILPPFCNEFELRELANRVDNALNKGVKRFRVTSLYALSLIKERCEVLNINYDQLKICTSYPLPIANSMAAMAIIDEYSLNKVQATIELEKDAIMQLSKNLPYALEIYGYGRPQLLITRAKVAVDGEIKDVMENHFLVKHQQNLAIIYPKEVLSIPGINQCAVFIDLLNARAFEEEQKDFNYNLNWN